MIPTHSVADRHFALLAAGGGDGETIAMLMAGQFSKHVLLIQAVLDRARQTATGAVTDRLEAAYDLLASVQQVDQEIVSTALTQPQVGIWATECLRGAAGYGYLAQVAAAAAVRAGQDFEIDVPVRAGLVALPGAGTIAVTGQDAAWVRVGVTGRGVTAGAVGRTVNSGHPGQIGPGLSQPHLLRVRADGRHLTVLLDDADPYRAPPGLQPAPALTTDQVGHWREALAQAWRLLVRHHPGHADALAAGLRVVVPLRAHGTALSNSATALDAFGAVMLTTPKDGPSLALTLMHEYQHGKLAALQDLIKLHSGHAEPRFYAPWRDDPRPFDALLQGAYAHLGVAEFWRVRRQSGIKHAALAHAQFAWWSAAIMEVADQLMASGLLTKAGERFVSGMTATVDRWHAEAVPDRARQLAADHGTSNRMAWRMRHLRPEPQAIDRLARAWLAGEDCPAEAPQILATVHPGARAPAGSARQTLALTLGIQPGELPQAGLAADREAAPAHASDLAYARGQYAAAWSAYRAELAADPAVPGAWVGVALTWQKMAAPQDRSLCSPAAALLASRPEIMRAVCLRIRALGAQTPDPVALATWIATPGMLSNAQRTMG